MLWKQFEADCTDYLNKNSGKHARFINKGGADSTVSDIKENLKRQELLVKRILIVDGQEVITSISPLILEQNVVAPAMQEKEIFQLL